EALDASFELVEDRSHIGTIVMGARAAELGILAWAGGNPVPLTPQEQAWRDEAYPVVLDLIDRGEFTVEIARTFPLSQAADAQRLVESGHPGGKVILLP
ncbi:MAG: zinc-binding dehydrogenase, partial [Leifsonia sp.]